MRTVFADSFFYFALVNPNDAAFARAVAFTRSYSGRMVTTGWVLTELADGWARPPARRAPFIQMLTDLRASKATVIVPTTDELLHAGIALFAQRPDKEWSLTDCLSFVVMEREGIVEALTGDRHFEQAGFKALLK